MRALCPDGEQLRPAAHEQNLLVSCMPEQLAPVGKLTQRNALR